jgi:hypothetical protein
MVESAVSRLLHFGESVIYTGKVFDMPNKSIVGSHSLHFTSKGIVLAYDSGGVFGSECVVQYDAIIDTDKKLVINLEAPELSSAQVAATLSPSVNTWNL